MTSLVRPVWTFLSLHTTPDQEMWIWFPITLVGKGSGLNGAVSCFFLEEEGNAVHISLFSSRRNTRLPVGKRGFYCSLDLLDSNGGKIPRCSFLFIKEQTNTWPAARSPFLSASRLSPLSVCIARALHLVMTTVHDARSPTHTHTLSSFYSH